jgi:hypothetical protein
MADGLTPERVEQAMARPGVGDELRDLGVRDVSGFPDPEFLWPERNEARIREVVNEALGPDAAQAKADDLVRGLPYLKADYEAAGKLHKAGKMTVDGIEKRRELSTKRAHRIYRQFVADAVLFDDAGLHPGPGYRWDPIELDNDPPRYKLIRA